MGKHKMTKEGRQKLASLARKTLKAHPEISRKGGKAASATWFKKGHPSGRNKGRKFDQQVRKHMSEAHLGKTSPNRGIHLSEETKSKVREGVLRRYEQNPEIKDVLREKRLLQILPVKDTKIEKAVQLGLSERGIAFETHPTVLGCQPDILLGSTAVFVDGCYWHACDSCGFGTGSKAEKRKAKDHKQTERLAASGYLVLRLWEHEITTNLANCIDRIVEATK